MNTRLTTIALVLCALVGCTRDPDTALDGKVHAPRTEAYPIELFMTSKPTRPYTEIRYIRVKVGNSDKLVAQLRRIARASGGDAVIKMESSTWHEGGLLGSEGGEMFNGVVVEYQSVAGAGYSPTPAGPSEIDPPKPSP